MGAQKKRKWLFNKPQGPSKKHYSSISTNGEILCQGCGTTHAELDLSDDSRRFLVFRGYQIVEECCGAYLDVLYDILGETFFGIWGNDFEQDPLANKHLLTRIYIQHMVTAWNKAAREASEGSDKILAQVPPT